MDRKPEAVAAACADGLARLEKIKKEGIHPGMSQEEQDALVEKLAQAKVATGEQDIKEARTKQRWYVESLIEFSGLPVEEQFETLYRRKFADQATETEILDVFRTYKAQPAEDTQAAA